MQTAQKKAPASQQVQIQNLFAVRGLWYCTTVLPLKNKFNIILLLWKTQQHIILLEILYTSHEDGCDFYFLLNLFWCFQCFRHHYDTKLAATNWNYSLCTWITCYQQGEGETILLYFEVIAHTLSLIYVQSSVTKLGNTNILGIFNMCLGRGWLRFVSKSQKVSKGYFS